MIAGIAHDDAVGEGCGRDARYGCEAEAGGGEDRCEIVTIGMGGEGGGRKGGEKEEEGEEGKRTRATLAPPCQCLWP